MNTSTNVVRLRQPEEFEDPLTDVLRSGARRLLAQAVELEAEAFLARMQDLKLPDGRDRLVRHGHGPERMIQTGIGPLAVSRVKIRDRGAASDDDRVRFSSSILPKWARRTRSLDALLPILLPSGGLDRRLPGGACGAPRPRCTELVAFSDRSAERGMAG
jgi:putative transposase